MKKTMRKFFRVFTSCLASCLTAILLIALSGCDFSFLPILPDNGEKEDVKISFAVAEKTLTIGDEEYLSPIYEKLTGFSLSYESSDPAVVSVDDEGKISAEREGTATVTATYASADVAYEASIKIHSSFSGYLPELKTMGVAKDIAIVVDDTYVILPYIAFNGKEFSDMSVDYEIVGDDGIAEISNDGEITALGKGTAQIVIKASWRGKDYSSAPTMQKVVNLSVIDDVRFYNDGESISDQSLYTLAELDGVAYENSMPCAFTMTVNGEDATPTITIANESVVQRQGDELVAVGFGETVVYLQKEINGVNYSKSFKITVERIEKEISDVVPLFETVEGTYFVEATGERKNVLSFIHETAQAVDAYQNGKALTVKDGKIFGVESSSMIERGEAQIQIGTNELIYTFTLETVAKAIVTAEDLKVLELTQGEIVSGYFELMNDIDATGLSLNHVITNAYFNGVFNGEGYVISNLSLNKASSMFGCLDGSATVKNFALVNLNATNAYFLAQDTKEDGLTVSNVYISLSENTQLPRGLTGRTGSNSVVKNVVIEYLGENAEQNRDYTERWSWQGLIGGMWSYTSEGKLYAQDKKWESVYVISPFVVSFRTDEKKDSADSSKPAAIYGYGANETTDIYGNSLSGASAQTRPNPNLGDYWWSEEYYNAMYTNLYRYDDYSALKTANADYSTFDSKYWVEYDGRIAWKNVAVSQVSAKIYDGENEVKEDTLFKTTNKELKIKAFIGDTEVSFASVTVENNSYVTWNNSKKAIVITSLPTTGNVKVKITVKVAVGDKTIEKVLYVTVSSRNVTPIQPGGDYDTDDRYDGYYGEIVTPIQPGGNYDAPDYGD